MAGLPAAGGFRGGCSGGLRAYSELFMGSSARGADSGVVGAESRSCAFLGRMVPKRIFFGVQVCALR